MKQSNARDISVLPAILLLICVVAAVQPRAVRACTPDPAAYVGVICANTGPSGWHLSGTKARAVGSWTATMGLKRVELWIDGSLRYERSWSSGHPTEWDYTVYFSTTQWAHGTRVEFTSKCWDVLNRAALPATKYYNMWNRGYSMWYSGDTYHPLPYAIDCAFKADSSCAFMRHSAPGPYGSHDEADIRAAIPDYSVFAAYTHGNATEFVDCVGSVDTVTWGEVADAVATKGGEQCSYNFVLAAWCYGADTDSFYTAFATRTFLGWRHPLTYSSHLRDWNNEFSNELVAQGTVFDARAKAHLKYGEVEMSAIYGDDAYRVYKTYW